MQGDGSQEVQNCTDKSAYVCSTTKSLKQHRNMLVPSSLRVMLVGCLAMPALSVAQRGVVHGAVNLLVPVP